MWLHLWQQVVIWIKTTPYHLKNFLFSTQQVFIKNILTKKLLLPFLTFSSLKKENIQWPKYSMAVFIYSFDQSWNTVAKVLLLHILFFFSKAKFTLNMISFSSHVGIHVKALTFLRICTISFVASILTLLIIIPLLNKHIQYIFKKISWSFHLLISPLLAS